MTERPFHHGDLRAALLTEAARTVRDEGVDALSLRELARRTGVSHAAPRRHFPDRQALLDALAVQGFRQLTASVREAADASAGYQDRFRRVSRAYVRFAIDEASLMELMFAAKNEDPPPALQQAAGDFFTTVGQYFEQGRSGTDGYPDRRQLLLVATLQGIATLVATGRLPADQVDDLIDDTTDLFTGARPASAAHRRVDQ